MIVAARIRYRLIFALLVIVAITAGPAVSLASQPIDPDADVIKAAYRAADHLEKHLISEISRVMPVVSTGFANLQHGRSHPTAFGAMLGQLVASRFSQHGYTVVDGAGSGKDPFAGVKAGQSALLSGPKDIMAGHEPQAVIQGDYLVSGNVAYVSVRIVRITDNIILTSCDFAVHLNEGLREMAESRPPDQSLRQQAPQTVMVDLPADPSAGHPKQETAVSDPDKGDEEKRPGKPINGPLSTGEIVLHPSNQLAAKIIQTRLAELGFYRDKIDGIWKDRSRKALREFKEARGLKYTLRWDMSTQKALFAGTGQ